MAELRVDPLTGARVMIEGRRQRRPRTGESDCPFCPGGTEAPDPYRVRRFPNRWPALGEGRCDVLLYSPDHEAAWATMGVEQAVRAVGMWRDCTLDLGSRPGVGYVLLFENRGAAAGATVDHPHGQAFGLAEPPPTTTAQLRRGADGGPCPLCAGPARELLVATDGDWSAWVPEAPLYPYALRLAPREHIADLPTCGPEALSSLARLLTTVLRRVDRFFGGPAPYFLWVHQRPTDGGVWPSAHLYLEIDVVWRSPGVPRYVAAGELGSGIYFTSLEPEVTARRLREA
ncbi:galactose-1-phosphate uridylyltransferase [Streptomyces amakusaensis]|uniref:Galactose-1-phosphate uridylyltransferase n=1 Tax=Streptomyces amakusaensis TaxID=67271 RepID=A0ABW0ANH7_9ACTN